MNGQHAAGEGECKGRGVLHARATDTASNGRSCRGSARRERQEPATGSCSKSKAEPQAERRRFWHVAGCAHVFHDQKEPQRAIADDEDLATFACNVRWDTGGHHYHTRHLCQSKEPGDNIVRVEPVVEEGLPEPRVEHGNRTLGEALQRHEVNEVEIQLGRGGTPVTCRQLSAAVTRGRLECRVQFWRPHERIATQCAQAVHHCICARMTRAKQIVSPCRPAAAGGALDVSTVFGRERRTASDGGLCHHSCERLVSYQYIGSDEGLGHAARVAGWRPPSVVLMAANYQGRGG
eukprot:6358849-Prymnesium_polylepis.1